MPVVPIGSPSAAVTDLATMTAEVRNLLDDNPLVDTIDKQPTGTIAAGTTSVNFGDGTAWALGDRVDWADGTDDCALVLSGTGTPPASVNPYTLVRSWKGTTATSHSSLSLVWKNPAFLTHQIISALTDAIRDIYPWAYVLSTASIVPILTTTYYDLPTDFRFMVDATQQTTSTSPITSVRYGPLGSLAEKEASVELNVPSAIASTGRALYVPGLDNVTNSILITYGANLTTSNVTLGIMSDCIVIGAVSRLTKAREVGRVNYEDLTQGDQSVVPSSRMRIGLAYEQEYFQRKLLLRAELIRTAGDAWKQYVRG